MIKSTLITATSVTNPDLVFTSTVTGGVFSSPGNPEQPNAITTMVLCNIGAPNASDETVNDVVVNVYLVPKGGTPQSSGSNCNLIISQLTVPAGETVFLSEERIVLAGGDEIHVGTDTANTLCVTVSALAV